MTTPTLIVTPPSPPAPSYSANRVPQPSLMDKIKKIAAIASLILIGTIGFLALLGHLVGFLISSQITIVLLALFIISLAGNALYLQKTANLHLYQDLQREVRSLKEINFMLSVLQKEFLHLSKEFATTSKDLSAVSQDFYSCLQGFRDNYKGFESLLDEYKNSTEEMRKLFSQEIIADLKGSVASLREEIRFLTPLAEEVRRLAHNQQSLTVVIEELKTIRDSLRDEIGQLSQLSKTLTSQIALQRKESSDLCSQIRETLSSPRKSASPSTKSS
ncbi:inclusion membrane protein IncA [Chlamydia trachomatis]|nr:inclusion membrane protein IncA [Chlamydia trachomatis]CCP47496.1 IncA protein [Chlamydia trachomatis A/363]CCP48395.1 IncA protein [Chlamydia trachomatis A/5291]CCP49294.1 IncA protein [Chlamydia trachomatis A/7249]